MKLQIVLIWISLIVLLELHEGSAFKDDSDICTLCNMNLLAVCKDERTMTLKRTIDCAVLGVDICIIDIYKALGVHGIDDIEITCVRRDVNWRRITLPTAILVQKRAVPELRHSLVEDVEPVLGEGVANAKKVDADQGPNDKIVNYGSMERSPEVTANESVDAKYTEETEKVAHELLMGIHDADVEVDPKLEIETGHILNEMNENLEEEKPNVEEYTDVKAEMEDDKAEDITEDVIADEDLQKIEEEKVIIKPDLEEDTEPKNELESDNIDDMKEEDTGVEEADSDANHVMEPDNIVEEKPSEIPNVVGDADISGEVNIKPHEEEDIDPEPELQPENTDDSQEDIKPNGEEDIDPKPAMEPENIVEIETNIKPQEEEDIDAKPEMQLENPSDIQEDIKPNEEEDVDPKPAMKPENVEEIETDITPSEEGYADPKPAVEPENIELSDKDIQTDQKDDTDLNHEKLPEIDENEKTEEGMANTDVKQEHAANGSESIDYQGDQPVVNEDENNKPNTNVLIGVSGLDTHVNCYSCTTTEEESCNTSPNKTIFCLFMENPGNGCYSLFKMDTNVTTRGCISDLTDTGMRLCKKNTKSCNICFKPLCNNGRMPSSSSAIGPVPWTAVLVLVAMAVVQSVNTA